MNRYEWSAAAYFWEMLTFFAVIEMFLSISAMWVVASAHLSLSPSSPWRPWFVARRVFLISLVLGFVFSLVLALGFTYYYLILSSFFLFVFSVLLILTYAVGAYMVREGASKILLRKNARAASPSASVTTSTLVLSQAQLEEGTAEAAAEGNKEEKRGEAAKGEEEGVENEEGEQDEEVPDTRSLEAVSRQSLLAGGKRVLPVASETKAVPKPTTAAEHDEDDDGSSEQSRPDRKPSVSGADPRMGWIRSAPVGKCMTPLTCHPPSPQAEAQVVVPVPPAAYTLPSARVPHKPMPDHKRVLDRLMYNMFKLAFQIASCWILAVLLTVTAGINTALEGPQYATEWLVTSLIAVPLCCNLMCLSHLSRPIARATRGFYQGRLWQPNLYGRWILIPLLDAALDCVTTRPIGVKR